MRFLFMVTALLFSLGTWAQARNPDRTLLPDPTMTPGALNPAVTEPTIDTTICVRGWTRLIRPPVRYTEPLKRAQIRAYRYPDRRPWHYEEDHLIPLDLGGSPTSPLNLWPEPHLGPDEWGAYAKDRLEGRMVRLVCRHKILLERAQAMMARNWVSAYRQFVGPAPNNQRPHH